MLIEAKNNATRYIIKRKMEYSSKADADEIIGFTNSETCLQILHLHNNTLHRFRPVTSLFFLSVPLFIFDDILETNDRVDD